MSEPATTLRFAVEVQSIDLGVFTKLEGLSVSYERTQVIEGGLNDYVHQLPGRVTYEPLRLTRPLDGTSHGILNWFSTLAKGGGHQRLDATITAFDSNRAVVARWSVIGVYPSRYQGPTFDLDGSGIAMETLELVHNGFLSKPIESEVLGR